MDERFDRLVQTFGTPRALRSAYAPGWHYRSLVLADIRYLAMGSGPSPGAAIASCLGEAAEIRSVLHRDGDGAFSGTDLKSEAEIEIPAAQATSRDANSPDDPGNEGAAASRTLDDAIRAALLERLERAAIHDWWTGKSSPAHILPDWLAAKEIDRLVAAARAHASRSRSTGLLALAGPLPAWTIAAVSREPDGSAPVLGYGAAPDAGQAARKAIGELFQMELGLTIARQAAAQGAAGPHRSIFDRIRALEGDRAGLLDPAESLSGEALQARPHDGSVQAIASHCPGQVIAVDITRDDIAVPVARVLTPALPRARPLKFAAASPL